MKTIKILPLFMTGLLVVLMTSCGPAYVNTGGGYGSGYYRARPYYGGGYGYNPYGYYRPPVIIRPQVAPRYYSPSPRYYGGSPGGGYNGGRSGGGYSGGRSGGGNGGGGRSRGPR